MNDEDAGREKKKLPDEILKEEELLLENREKTQDDIRKAANDNEKPRPKNEESVSGD